MGMGWPAATAASSRQLAHMVAPGRPPAVPPPYQLRRDGLYEKRARCRIGIPDVINGQRAGCNSALGPATKRGPECYPAAGPAQPLRRAAAARDEASAAPETGRAGHGSRQSGGSSPSTRSPAVASPRQRSPKASRQSSPCAPSRCTRLPSPRSSAASPPIGSRQPAHCQ